MFTYVYIYIYIIFLAGLLIQGIEGRKIFEEFVKEHINVDFFDPRKLHPPIQAAGPGLFI